MSLIISKWKCIIFSLMQVKFSLIPPKNVELPLTLFTMYSWKRHHVRKECYRLQGVRRDWRKQGGQLCSPTVTGTCFQRLLFKTPTLQITGWHIPPWECSKLHAVCATVRREKWLYAKEKQWIRHNNIVCDMHANKDLNMVIISDQGF